MPREEYSWETVLALGIPLEARVTGHDNGAVVLVLCNVFGIDIGRLCLFIGCSFYPHLEYC